MLQSQNHIIYDPSVCEQYLGTRNPSPIRLAEFYAMEWHEDKEHCIFMQRIVTVSERFNLRMAISNLNIPTLLYRIRVGSDGCTFIQFYRKDDAVICKMNFPSDLSELYNT